MHPVFAGLASLVVLVGAARATAAEVVSVKPPGAILATAGQDALAVIQVAVKHGYHVQANPVRNPSLIPIVLDVKADRTVVPGSPIYPSAKTMRLDGSEEDLVVYDGTFVVQLPLKIAPDAQRGRVTLNGTLRYQACDDRHCLFPVTLPVKLVVQVGGQ